MTNIIEIKGLKKAFGSKQSVKMVLDGVNLDIKKGEIVALLGENGSGKTTIINILATLLKPDEGKIKINGYDVEKEDEQVRKSISLTGQFASVDDLLTGRENLELIAKLRKVQNPKKVASEMLEKVSLQKAADARLQTYSGGMRRRIDIGMSLIGAPAIIFLDEPTTGLDPEARKGIYELIRKLAASGTTIFLTTQYLEEAELLSDRIAILYGGKIIANEKFSVLKQMFPSPKKEMVEKQPTLEEIFLAIISKEKQKQAENQETKKGNI